MGKFTAEQAKHIASKVDLKEYIVDCILRRIEMLAKKGAVCFDFTLKSGDLCDANDALYLKMGFNDDFEYIARTFLLGYANGDDIAKKVKAELENLGYSVSEVSWQSDYNASAVYTQITW
jgi:hypothetical protein